MKTPLEACALEGWIDLNSVVMWRLLHKRKNKRNDSIKRLLQHHALEGWIVLGAMVVRQLETAAVLARLEVDLGALCPGHVCDCTLGQSHEKVAAAGGMHSSACAECDVSVSACLLCVHVNQQFKFIQLHPC